MCVLCEAEAGKPWRDMSKDERRQFKQEGRTFTCRGCRTPKRTPSVASMVSCPCLLLCNARLHAAFYMNQSAALFSCGGPSDLTQPLHIDPCSSKLHRCSACYVTQSLTSLLHFTQPREVVHALLQGSHGRRSPLWNLVSAPAHADATVLGSGSNSTQQPTAAWQPDLCRIQSGQLLNEEEQQQPPSKPSKGPSSPSLVPIGEQRLAAMPVASQAQPCTAASETSTAEVAGVETLSIEDAGVAAAHVLNTIAHEAALAAVRPDKAHGETGCEAELASYSSVQAASEDAVPKVSPVRAG